MAILVENKDYELRQNSQNNDLYELFFKGIYTGLKLKLKEDKDKYKNIVFQADIAKKFPPEKKKDESIIYQAKPDKDFPWKEMTLEPLSTDTIIDINLNSIANVNIETKDNILLVKDELKIGEADNVNIKYLSGTKSYDDNSDNIMVEKMSIDNSKNLNLSFENVVKKLTIESVNNNGVSKEGNIFFKKCSSRDIEEINLNRLTTVPDSKTRKISLFEFSVCDNFIANNVLLIDDANSGWCGFTRNNGIKSGANNIEFRNAKISFANRNIVTTKSIKIINSEDKNQSLYTENEPVDFDQWGASCDIKCKEFICIDEKVSMRYSKIKAPDSIVIIGGEGSSTKTSLRNTLVSSTTDKDIHLQNLMVKSSEIEYTPYYNPDVIEVKNLTTNGASFVNVVFSGDNVEVTGKNFAKTVFYEEDYDDVYGIDYSKKVIFKSVVFNPLSNVKIDYLEDFKSNVKDLIFSKSQFDGDCILKTNGIAGDIENTKFSNTKTTIELKDNVLTQLKNVDDKFDELNSEEVNWVTKGDILVGLRDKLKSFSIFLADSTLKGENKFILQDTRLTIDESNIENCKLSNIEKIKKSNMAFLSSDESSFSDCAQKGDAIQNESPEENKQEKNTKIEESNIANFSSDENYSIDYVKKNETEPVQENNIVQNKIKETSKIENQKQGRIMKKTEKGFLYQYDSGLIGKVSDLDKLDGYKMFLSVVADANGKSNVFNNFRISGKIDTLKLQSTVEEYIKSTSDLSEIVDKTIKSTILQGMQDNLVLNRHVYEPYLKRLNDTFAEVVNSSNIKDEQIKKDALTGFLYAGSRYANPELDNLRAEYAKINITEGSNNGLNFNNALTFQDSNFISTAAFTTAEGTRVTRATLEIKEVDFDGNFKAHFSCVTPNGAPKYIPVSGNLDDLVEGKLKFDLTGKEKIKDIEGITEAYNNSLVKNFSYIKKHLDIPGLDTEEQLNTAVQTEADAIRKYGKREPSEEELAEIRQTKLDEINAGLQPKIDIFLDTLPAQLKKGMSVNVGRQVGGEIATRFGFQGWNGFVNSMLDMLPSAEEIKPLATKVVAMAESLEKEKALEVKPEVKEKTAEIER